MKKFMALLMVSVLCLTFFADNADAYRRSGGFRSTPRPTTPHVAPKPAQKKYNINNGFKTDPNKKVRKQKPNKPLGEDKSYTVPPNGKNRAYYDQRYSGRSYYRGGSFASQLLTAAGVYLLLDHFTHQGDPVYVNAETGEELSKEELEKMDTQPVDKTETSDQKEEKNTSLSSYLLIGVGLLAVGFLFGRRRRA